MRDRGYFLLGNVDLFTELRIYKFAFLGRSKAVSDIQIDPRSGLPANHVGIIIRWQVVNVLGFCVNFIANDTAFIILLFVHGLWLIEKRPVIGLDQHGNVFGRHIVRDRGVTSHKRPPVIRLHCVGIHNYAVPRRAAVLHRRIAPYPHGTAIHDSLIDLACFVDPDHCTFEGEQFLHVLWAVEGEEDHLQINIVYLDVMGKGGLPVEASEYVFRHPIQPCLNSRSLELWIGIPNYNTAGATYSVRPGFLLVSPPQDFYNTGGRLRTPNRTTNTPDKRIIAHKSTNDRSIGLKLYLVGHALLSYLWDDRLSLSSLSHIPEGITSSKQHGPGGASRFPHRDPDHASMQRYAGEPQTDNGTRKFHPANYNLHTWWRLPPAPELRRVSH